MPKRDYIYVDDIADGLIAMLDSEMTFGSVNIGSGEAFSAEDIVNTLSKLLEKEIAIDSVPEKQRAGDRPFLCADNERLRKLGWSCRYNLDEAMKATLRAYGFI